MSNKRENKSKDKENKKSKKKSKKLKIILLFILLIILIAGGVFAYKTQKNGGGLSGMLATAVGHDENTKKCLSEFKLLLMGVSTDQAGVALTDTIMVASYNPNLQKATLLSIPRDSFTGTNVKKAKAADKINAIYNITRDPMKTVEEVNKLTGLDLEYYAIVQTEALIELVDAIGSIQYEVPTDMNYDDPTQNLHIHFKKGLQEINGEKAEELLRFRKNNNGTSFPIEYGDNDIGRMRNQREFIKAVIEQTVKLENITKLGKILDIANRNLITNLNFNILKDYLPYAVEFNTENLKNASLPGTVPNISQTNGVSIFVVNKEETSQLVNELFYYEQSEETENTSTDNTIKQDNTVKKSNVENVISSENSEIKIEVLNGTNDGKILQDVVNKLKNAGYNVAKTGTTTLTSKTIIANKSNLSTSNINEIKNTMKVGMISESNTETSNNMDVTIIIGKDYKEK